MFTFSHSTIWATLLPIFDFVNVLKRPLRYLKAQNWQRQSCAARCKLILAPRRLTMISRFINSLLMNISKTNETLQLPIIHVRFTICDLSSILSSLLQIQYFFCVASWTSRRRSSFAAAFDRSSKYPLRILAHSLRSCSRHLKSFSWSIVVVNFNSQAAGEERKKKTRAWAASRKKKEIIEKYFDLVLRLFYKSDDSVECVN